MLVTKNSTYAYAKKESGGKGFNLYLMTEQGLPVPDWVVFGKRYFQSYVDYYSLTEKMNQIIDELNRNKISASQAENEFSKLFLDPPTPDFLVQELKKALRHFSSEDTLMFSVRSSAADEDGVSHSFAGQLSSFLYLSDFEEIIFAMRKCWASGFTERGLVYRRKNNISVNKIQVSVVLQKMIDPDESGVLFTCDPVSQKLDHYVISAVRGVGEGLVSGALPADTFWLENSTGLMVKRDIVEKKTAMKKGKQGETVLIDMEEREWLRPALSEKQLLEIWKLGKFIEGYFQRPQDIEWAIQGEKLYILQTRPVTHLEQDLVGYPNLWDNSNIVESYGGLTLPLSFSFALRNYKNVYVQFCEVLNVPRQVIKEMDSYLSYMLGNINGRVYYNLFNWYKLVGILPGFKQNREFMETMMGVSEKLTDEITERIKPHPSWNTLEGKVRKLVTGLSFFKYHLTIQSMVTDFLKTFHKDYDYYRSLPLKKLRGDQLIQVYSELEMNMLGRWKAPIVNDFLCMVHFGLLRKLTLKWLSQFDSTIQNDLLSGEGGLESAEPMKALKKLTMIVFNNPSLRNDFLKYESSELLEFLKQSTYQEFYAEVMSYLDRFGFRCMSEMKLEEIDLNTDPTYLFVCIKNYLKSSSLELIQIEEESALRKTAEAKVETSLKGFQKVFYFWVLKHARKAVKNRENTRFARTRVYGIARNIFQYVGQDLAQLGIIEKDRDIFWLNIEEIFGIYNGTLTSYDLQSFIELRKKSYKSFELTTPDVRILTRGAVYWHNQFVKEVEAPSYDGEDCDLKGMPCCPGIIEGVVKYISSPQDNLELNGEILVADRTDPGWVPLYPSIKGLLVERGSLLSHSAIVAREMGIPTIVSIPGLTKKLKSGMKVKLDGKAGTIKILSEGESICSSP
ncbi:MAG: phosphoenolpyruvate synthase [Deltaproteobacteria bacterium]|nr:phosphoenolpyruvate synthase [Deltaproteobacteria bacterium]